MTALDGNALIGTFILEGARVVVLGYVDEARDHALALRRAGNSVVVIAHRDTPAWTKARGDGFEVDHTGAAISTADVVVVRAHEDTPLWRQCEERIAGGALVVFASARALHSGRCARSGMDVVLVTNIDVAHVGCRLAVHRDVSRRALLRAVAYARAAYGADVPMRSTNVSDEADLEHADIRERSARLLALTVQAPPIAAEKAPTHAWDADEEAEPADLGDAQWFHAMMNRRGTP